MNVYIRLTFDREIQFFSASSFRLTNVYILPHIEVWLVYHQSNKSF